jgi:hypothetical protein
MAPADCLLSHAQTKLRPWLSWNTSAANALATYFPPVGTTLSCASGELSGAPFLVNVIGFAWPKSLLQSAGAGRPVKYYTPVGLLNGALANQASSMGGTCTPKASTLRLVLP